MQSLSEQMRRLSNG
nr:hypothetical protein [uncultured Pantoea sp.]